jgi:hypothetical protein
MYLSNGIGAALVAAGARPEVRYKTTPTGKSARPKISPRRNLPTGFPFASSTTADHLDSTRSPAVTISLFAPQLFCESALKFCGAHLAKSSGKNSHRAKKITHSNCFSRTSQNENHPMFIGVPSLLLLEKNVDAPTNCSTRRRKWSPYSFRRKIFCIHSLRSSHFLNFLQSV